MLAGEQVIDAVAALIRAGGGYATSYADDYTSAGATVFTDRAWPLEESDLPAWRVDSEGSDEQIADSGPQFPSLQLHELTVYCRAYVRDVDGMRTARAALGSAALATLFGSVAATRLSPLNCSMRLEGIERGAAKEGEAAVGVLTLRVLVSFHTSSNAPEVIH